MLGSLRMRGPNNVDVRCLKFGNGTKWSPWEMSAGNLGSHEKWPCERSIHQILPSQESTWSVHHCDLTIGAPRVFRIHSPPVCDEKQ